MVGRGDRDSILREVGHWLDGGRCGDPARVARWDAARWWLATDICYIQGVAGRLHAMLPETEVAGLMPSFARDRLAEHRAWTTARAGRVHRDLSAILGAAAEAGVALMPLKGALLTTLGLVDPGARPIGDLDLLIREADRVPMLAAMGRLGYASSARYRDPGREELTRRGDTTVVSWSTEHPDNPCPVELLWRVDKRPWSRTAVYDLTELLWTDARPAVILGHPAMRPTDRALLVHIAGHAAMNLVAGTGRLSQFLDVAAVARRAPSLEGIPNPRLVHLALTIAGRLVPTDVPESLSTILAPSVPRMLRRWAASVPLDTRVGLTDGLPPQLRSPRARVWARWRPSPWRLWATHEGVSLAGAYIRHGRAMVERYRWRRRSLARRGRISP